MSAPAFRPPSVPLVTHTPYFSSWSSSDRLADSWPRHWTGGNTALQGLIWIDGKAYRWMGSDMTQSPALEQKSVEVTPTRSIYTFEGAGVRFVVTFLSPLLCDDIETLARPVTYLYASAQSLDGVGHKVRIYVDASAEWCVPDGGYSVIAGRHRVGGLDMLSFRGKNQPVLERAGDQIRIDWGTFYLGAVKQAGVTVDSVVCAHDTVRSKFASGGTLVEDDDLRFPRSAGDNWPVLALTADLGQVDSKPKEACYLLGYDEDFSIEYFHRKLRPYWNRNEIGAAAMFKEAAGQASAIRAKSEAFDKKLTADLERAGGPEYAQLGALAYRQCLAGHGLVADINGDMLMFSKENTSNGCMATVDVTFPASPFFLYFSPELLEAQLRPVMDYSSMSRWRFPFAPHDLGTYPKSNGQVYGGGERNEENQMPVEESANMILMVAGMCKTSKDYSFASKHKKVLDTWADYLLAKGLDPENQLCTDDFTGHLAHNANLSLKAILAIAAHGELCNALGDSSRGKKLKDSATALASKWIEMAADGDHTKLAFDRSGTWSLKYNLIWQKILGLKLFPESLAKSELAYYKAKQNSYGVPLDNRATFTKTDWVFWAASLSDSKQGFMEMIQPVYKMTQETKSRVPFSDWYDTKDARTMGMHTRTVIGGIFVRLIAGG